MNYLDFISEFFSHIKCSNCQEFFKDDSIHIVRQETNSIVVRIICSRCEKNLGLAILGLDRAEYKNSLKFKEDESIPISSDSEPEPITYDDVIKAHDFFYSLGEDWAKHYQKKNKLTQT